ncbi:MAG: hypothetical protein E6J79_03920 [Deltaproteobacteria bacterium]|nr:MAG: hypothetical protein E6J79_03920 [Deltaproteobacteria bacterium]
MSASSESGLVRDASSVSRSDPAAASCAALHSGAILESFALNFSSAECPPDDGVASSQDSSSKKV